MNFWLIRSEPDVYSFQKLQSEGTGTWDGVRNYQARNNLRAMKLGDLCLFYHSNIGLEIVGIARVSREYFPDTTAEKGDWSAVEVQALQLFSKPVNLPAVKAHPSLQHMLLVRNPRISVMPVSAEEFEILLKMGETEVEIKR